MAYHFENIKLEKGMYGRSGRSFSQALEELDPSEHYRGTPLEGLDAFQRQLKRFDIKVSGPGSDPVERFFATSAGAALFPEYVSRAVRQGMERASKVTDLVATVTKVDGMDYRTIDPEGGTWEPTTVAEGAQLPQATLRLSSGLVKLYKRGQVLQSSYEALRLQKLDLFTVALAQVGAGIAAAQMGDDEPQILIGLSQLLRGLAGGAFLIQCVKKALPLHPGAAGDTRQVRQLVHADGVDEKRRQPCRACQPIG